jgi:uncharacterized protein (TIGR03084 family)
MLPQAQDLRAEGADFYAFLDTLKPEDWDKPTPFKGWTPNDVVQHLHMGDWMAVLSMSDEKAFLETLEKRKALRDAGQSEDSIGPKMETGTALREQWYGYFHQLCDLLNARDPKDRVLWVGPSMSVRMCATARQMETWAHAQDIYDMLRAPRVHHDRIKNIAEIGLRTYGWTFANRGETPPAPEAPYIRLTAPSGAVWEWGQPDDGYKVEGSGLEFCQVVTQGRNIADVSLNVVGEPAQKWMALAQCFAGPPRNPPEPGARAW